MGFRKSLFLRPFSKFFAILAVSALALSSGGCAAKNQSSGSSGSGGLTMEEALMAAAANMMASIDAGTKVAVLNYSSPSECLSEYVVSELEANIVETGKVTVVDRKELDLIRSEMDFQYSSEVRNESAQDLGRKLGAQVIITGTHTDLAGAYRILVRALVVESAVVLAQYRTAGVADAVVTALVKNCDKGKGAAAPVTQVAQVGGGAVPAAAAPAAEPVAAAPAAAKAQPAAIANGKYIYYPRLRAVRGGVDIDDYIVQIVVRGGYFIVYMTNVPIGKGNAYRNSAGWNYKDKVILQDLDRPSRAYNMVNHSLDDDGNQLLTFQNVTGTRFSLINTERNPNVIFEEIILEKAEFEAP